MRSLFLIGLAALLGAAPALAQPGSTLAQVRARGSLVCGADIGLLGFSQRDAQGVVRGLDADTCRAVAAAVLGDADKVTFTGGSRQQQLMALREGRIELAASNLTQTMARDVDLGLSPTAVNYYDGQGFLVPASPPVANLAGLDGKRICITSGTTTEMGLADAARRLSIQVTPVVVGDAASLAAAYREGRCDAMTSDISELLVLRQTGTTDPAAHVLLPDIISREPLGPLVRDGDSQWRSIVFWVVNLLLEAEAREITAANAEARKNDPSAIVRRMMGGMPGFGTPLGLADDWGFQVISQVGNYGEIYERNLGEGSSLKIDRGLNALWNRGGLMYPIPMR
ncbi:amino acid ABC transporter substrate-binding protein [Falsiroseomonas selenitidurans]|uniref:Amino acid ABC transporter substrate-binding protein n=1 Tax=Falsiroseomonas selenitidurans TaxID=2716335 RepID=A0ABX1E1H7_9PROT|nr:amino acid ABC transporter substrate-binding protein [Falsiroseomonas selenitidurans]NKC29663.1 amino acid ABC transporter substrate-binding protein [Falsiroseomonas selenitidurans]